MPRRSLSAALRRVAVALGALVADRRGRDEQSLAHLAAIDESDLSELGRRLRRRAVHDLQERQRGIRLANSGDRMQVC